MHYQTRNTRQWVKVINVDVQGRTKGGKDTTRFHVSFHTHTHTQAQAPRAITLLLFHASIVSNTVSPASAWDTEESVRVNTGTGTSINLSSPREGSPIYVNLTDSPVRVAPLRDVNWHRNQRRSGGGGEGGGQGGGQGGGEGRSSDPAAVDPWELHDHPVCLCV